MAGRENEIGACKCPVCGSKTARLRVSAKSLAYVTCNTCNSQVFARSDRSDDALRALHVPDAAPAPVAAPAAPAAPPKPAPAPAPVVTPVTPAPVKPAAPAPIQPPKQPAPSGLGWGILA